MIFNFNEKKNNSKEEISAIINAAWKLHPLPFISYEMCELFHMCNPNPIPSVFMTQKLYM